METIKVVKYGDNGWEETDNEVSVYHIARSIKKSEQIAELLHEYLNVGMKDYREGVRVGQVSHSAHRTIQGSLVRFCLGILVGLSEQEYTDARNEIPIDTCKKIKTMLESGELNGGYLI